MTTYQDSDQINSRRYDDRRRQDSERRQVFARAFTLGSVAALLCGGMIFLAVALTHHHTTGSVTKAQTPAATVNHTAAATTGTATTATPQYPTGAWVTQLQKDLGQLNYYESPVDGVYGPQTVAAVQDFQRANGLPVTGTANAATMALIQKQLITGDNQMGGSGLPKHPAAANGTSTNGGSGHSSTTSGGQSINS